MSHHGQLMCCLWHDANLAAGSTCCLQVFERVARPVVLTTLQGFNGTIFAYGQTGSGKTFTITGGAERYVERGIIPRTIACMYSEVAKHADYTFQVRPEEQRVSSRFVRVWGVAATGSLGHAVILRMSGPCGFKGVSS